MINENKIQDYFQNSLDDILQQNLTESEKVKVAKHLLYNHGLYKYNKIIRKMLLLELIKLKFFDYEKFLNEIDIKKFITFMDNLNEIPSEFEKVLSKYDEEYKKYKLKKYKEIDDFRGYLVIHSIIARIKNSEQMLEAFEYFAENDETIFIRLISIYHFFDPSFIFKKFDYEKILNLLPTNSFKFLTDGWINLIIKNPKLLQILNTLPYEKRKAIIDELPNEILYSQDFLKNLSVDSKNYDVLPKDIRCREDVKILFNRGEVLDYNLKEDWTDKENKIVSYFTLSNNLEPKNKHDYMLIYEKYIEENISIEAFCTKYKISSVDGFKEMLDRIYAENYNEGLKIKDIKKNAQDRYFRKFLSNIYKILRNEMTIDELLNEQYNKYYTFNNFITYCGNEIDKEMFSKKIVEYYATKNLEQYTLNDKNFLDFDDKKSTNYEDFKNLISPFLTLPKDKKFYIMLAKIRNDFEKLKIKYKRQNLPYLYKKSGNSYEINDDVIDQAFCYAKKHNIWESQVAISEIAKKIVVGEINLKEETERIKEEMKKTLLQMLSEINTIEEYLEFISSYSDYKKE